MIYLVRHCQTEDNNRKVLCSSTDLDLSCLGESQAKRVAAFFVDKKIDCILTSDLKRAKQTADYINNACRSSIIECPWLRERLVPSHLSNLKYEDLVKQRQVMGHRFVDPSQDWHNVDGVEGDNEIYARFTRGFSNHLNEQTSTICVTHAGVIKAVLYSIFKIDPIRPNAFKVKNGCILSLQAGKNFEDLQLVEIRQIQEHDNV